MRNAANLAWLEPDDSWHDTATATLTIGRAGIMGTLAPLLVETAMAHRKLETKKMSVTELELKTLLLRKKKTGRNFERSELNWLCREIWRKRRALKGEKHLDKIKESAEMEKARKARKPRICSHNFLPRTLFDSNKPRRGNPIREEPLGGAVEKPESGLCWWNVDLAKENGTCPGETEKRERFTGSNHSRRFESIASGMFGEIGEIVVVDMLGYDFPGRLLCLSLTVMAPKVVGATCLTKFRFIAGLCAMRKVLGYVWLKSLPAARECADGVCAEVACRCCFFCN